MRIGFNLLFLVPDEVYGTKTYALSLLSSLADIDRENEYFVFVNQESADLELPNAPNVHRVVCKFRARRRPVRYSWEQIILPLQLRSLRIDLVHSLGYVGPLMAPCFSVVTVPDLNYVALKHTLPPVKRATLQFFSTHAARSADRVITISHFSKAEIARVLNIDSERITVTHLGPLMSQTTNSSVDWDEIREHYKIKEPYIVAFGGGTLHKNIPRLIEAFARVKKNFPQQLVLLGYIPPDVNLSAESMDQPTRDRITTTGYVPREHIHPLLNHADLFVLPSFYEGFGLPVVEAQQAGVAVACSTAASLPEVAGEGAAYFDPTSVESIAETIEECLGDPDLRAQLIKKGTANLKRFSWLRAAKETLAVYQSVYQPAMREAESARQPAG